MTRATPVTPMTIGSETAAPALVCRQLRSAVAERDRDGRRSMRQWPTEALSQQVILVEAQSWIAVEDAFGFIVTYPDRLLGAGQVFDEDFACGASDDCYCAAGVAFHNAPGCFELFAAVLCSQRLGDCIDIATNRRTDPTLFFNPTGER